MQFAVPMLLIFASALMFAIGGTPVVRRLAVMLGVIDHPNARKVHQTPIPLLGGVAIYGAFIAALVLFGSQFYIEQLVGILIGATWVSFLGIYDDWRGVRPLAKLAGQAVAALILIATGVQVEFLHNPVLNAAVTIFWVAGITNALNLLDNMDGLSGGVAAVAAGAFALLALANGQVLVGAMSLALLGASIGFLVYNFNPASIFMGDCGALFLGFLLSAVGIKLRFLGHSDEVTWMIPVLVLGVPVFDTTLVFISRLRRGLNPLTTPGKDHLSHRLVRLGLSPRRAVVCIYAIGLVLGLIAFIVQDQSQPVAYGLFGVILLIGALAIILLERVPSAQSTPAVEVKSGEQL